MLSRRSLSHQPSASCCALLTALLLLAAPVDLSSHHGCMDGAEKAQQELQFVWSRPQTAEIRCSRDALCRTGRRPSASCCALLTALLLLAVPVDLSSHHGCVDGAEKAHQELQFVWHAEFPEPPWLHTHAQPAKRRKLEQSVQRVGGHSRNPPRGTFGAG